MIYDSLSHLNRYRGFSKGLDLLMDWIAKTDLTQLPVGRSEIDGSRVFALVQDATTRRYEDARYETHRRYMDVQVDLVGEEHFMITTGPTAEVGSFDESSDKGYCLATSDNHAEIEGALKLGHFVVFMIGEPHMPNLVAPGTDPYPLHKICFKVLGDQFWDE